MSKVKDLPNFPEKKEELVPLPNRKGTVYTNTFNMGYNETRDLIGNLEIPRVELDERKITEILLGHCKKSMFYCSGAITGLELMKLAQHILIAYKKGELDK